MKIQLLFITLFYTLFSTAQIFSGTGGSIPDNEQQIEFDLSIIGLPMTPLNESFGLTQVCLNIDHSYDSDLNVSLVSPTGVVINLFSSIGGGDDNFTDTCLSQSATSSITSGTAPFTGTFKPQETLGNMNNGIQNGNGTWKLRILDTYPADQGTLLNWTLTFGANAATPFVFTSSNLPLVLINTNSQTIVDEPSIIATMKIIDNGAGNLNYVTDTTFDYDGNINIEYRGNYSQSLPQKPYKIEILDAAGQDADASLLGMPAESDWALLANYNDKVFMRNQLSYNLFTEMGHYGPKTRHCEVLVNGNYMGVFELSETIKRGNNRVDIAKLTVDENSGLDLTGGYIIKNDYWSTDDGWQLTHSPIDHPDLVIGLAYHYPKANKISVQQKAYIAGFIDDFEDALYSPDFASATLGYGAFMDEESFIDYFIMNELSRNNDGFKKSAYFYKDKDGATSTSKLFAGPVWDFDWAWKNIDECSFLAVTDGSGWAHWVNDCNPDVNGTGWFVRLLQDPNFQNHLRCRWDELRNTTLSTTALFVYIDQTALYLEDAQSRHFDRWGNLGIPTGSPEIDPDPATFPGQITKFKNWITTRMTWLDANMPGDAATCALGTTSPTKTIFTAYPNPVLNNLTIRYSQNISDVTIYNLLGQQLFAKTINATEGQVDLSSLASGTYLVKVQSGTTVETIKVMKQ